MKNTKNIIVIILVLAIFLMSAAYSLMATQLTIDGNAEIVGIWDVKISNVEVESCSTGSNPGDISFTNTSVVFNAKLLKPGDEVSYKVTIENAGSIDAALGFVVFKEEDNEANAISYETTEMARTLLAGEQTSFIVTISYDKNTMETPNVKTKSLTGIIEYVQK